MPRYDVIMTGVGGKGVLTAGLLLAQVGMNQYKNVLWFPSYQAAMRGGPCECTVVLSDDDIASPILSQTQSLIVMDVTQLRSFQDRVRPAGLLLIEKAGLKEKVSRSDVRVVEVPAVELALNMGDSQASNLILLGAYIQLTGAIPLSLMEKELEKRFAGKEKALAVNKKALNEGARLVAA